MVAEYRTLPMRLPSGLVVTAPPLLDGAAARDSSAAAPQPFQTSATRRTTDAACARPASADGARAAGSSTLRPIAALLEASGDTTATRDTMPVTWASTLAIGPIPRGMGARTTTRS